MVYLLFFSLISMASCCLFSTRAKKGGEDRDDLTAVQLSPSTAPMCWGYIIRRVNINQHTGLFA